MTKRSMLLSLASGKLGDMVFYRAGGEQRTRTRVVPKNPKTIAQMTQRLRMLNPSAIYRSLSSVLSASFVERKSNQSSANKFISDAISTLPYYITKAMKDELLCVPFGAKVASGNIGVRVEGTTKNVYPEKSGEPIQAMTYGCLFDASATSGGGFHDYPEAIAGVRGALLDDDFNAAFLRAALIPSVPDKFTISVIAGAPITVDEDQGIEAWRLGVRTYSVDGNTLSVSYRGCPEAEEFTHLHAVNRTAAGTTLEITTGFADSNGVDVAKHPTAIILAFEEEGQLKVTTSFISSFGATGITPKRNFVRFFKEGGVIYVQAMNEYGFTQGTALSAQQLNATQETEDGSTDAGGGGGDLDS